MSPTAGCASTWAFRRMSNMADIRLGLAWTDRDVHEFLPGADVGIVATGPPWTCAAGSSRSGTRGPIGNSPMSTAWAGVSPIEGGLYYDLFHSPLADVDTPAEVVGVSLA